MPATRSISSARLRAQQIIQELRILSPDEICIEDIAWTRGAHVREGPLEGADGRLVRGPRRGVILVRRDVPEPGKKRLIAAHELGHFELHRERAPGALCVEEQFHHWYARSPEEFEATDFASELLMPEALFQPRVDRLSPSFEHIEALAEEFQTSLTATAVRYAQSTGHRCALVVSKRQKIAWVVPSDEFRYWIQPGTPLDKNSYANDFFCGKSIAPGMQTVLASAWIKESRLDSSPTIKEESRALSRYETVLSLLWIEHDIEESDEEDESKEDPDQFTPNGKHWRW
jgi:hypothetical protein